MELLPELRGRHEGDGMILFAFMIGGMIGYFIAALMFMAGRGDDDE